MAKAAKKQPVKSDPKRAKIVWVALLAAMTGVGGLLLAIDNRPSARAGGVSLTPLVATGSTNAIEQIFLTDNPLDQQRWTGIVIHHSGSLVGGPVSIAQQQEQLAAKHGRKSMGLGHHFVIGNGRGGEMADGELHLGFRWMKQLPGWHAAGPLADDHNERSLSICLVGDGNRQSFTPAQIERLNQLVDSLRLKFRIPADRVLLHSDIATGVRDPGRLFPEADLRSRLKQTR